MVNPAWLKSKYGAPYNTRHHIAGGVSGDDEGSAAGSDGEEGGDGDDDDGEDYVGGNEDADAEAEGKQDGEGRRQASDVEYLSD